MPQKLRLLITEKEARKLLGVAAVGLTHEEVLKLIKDGEQIARFTIHQYLVRNAAVLK